MSYCVTDGLVVHYDDSPFWIFADLECPFQLKVCFLGGMFDLRTLYLSELTMHG